MRPLVLALVFAVSPFGGVVCELACDGVIALPALSVIPATEIVAGSHHHGHEAAPVDASAATVVPPVPSTTGSVRGIQPTENDNDSCDPPETSPALVRVVGRFVSDHHSTSAVHIPTVGLLPGSSLSRPDGHWPSHSPPLPPVRAPLPLRI